MKRLLRTLTIVAAIAFSVTMPAKAQRQSEGVAAETTPGKSVGTSVVDESNLEVAPQQFVQAAVKQPTSTSTRYGRSSGYGMSSSYTRPANRAVSRSKAQIFIIPAAAIEREDHLAIERDIHVMSHIFDRVLKEPVKKIGGVFTVMDDFFGRDSHVTQVIYADGYGAMFFIDVDFALVGPPPASDVKEPNMPEEQVDTIWKQAERELYAPPNVIRHTESVTGPAYDAEKVELLKKNLVETLKHTANIQALKPDESVVLTVTGRAITSTTVVSRGESVKWIFRSNRWEPLSDESRTASYPMLAPSILTIRAKKSYIDAFSKGELDFNEFYERTQLLANWSGSTGTISRRGTTSLGFDAFGR